LEAIPKQHAHRLFQCLVAAIRPHRIEELAEIFAIDFDTDTAPDLMEGWRPENPEDALLSAYSTLIVVTEGQWSKIVQFSHLSVKGFLTSDRLRTSYVGSIRRYHILLDSAHTILGRASLSAAAIGQNVDKTRLRTLFLMALHAAEYWIDHAKYDDVERLLDTSKSYFAAWAGICKEKLRRFDGPFFEPSSRHKLTPHMWFKHYHINWTSGPSVKIKPFGRVNEKRLEIKLEVTTWTVLHAGLWQINDLVMPERTFHLVF
jgi:hypothetical protein